MSNSLHKVLFLQYVPSALSQYFGVLSAAVTSSLPDINEAVHTLFLMLIMALERSCLNTIELISSQSVV